MASSSHNAHGGGYVPGQSRHEFPQAAHGGGYIPGMSSPPHSSKPPSAAPNQHYTPSPPQGAYHPYQNASQPAYRPQDTQSGASSPPSNLLKSRTEAKLSMAQVDDHHDVPPFVQHQRQRPVHLKGNLHLFFSEVKFRWKFPNFYQLPVLVYDVANNFRHRDCMDRVLTSSLDDRYLSPYDGHLAKLHVQTTDEIYDSAHSATWRRTYIRQTSSFSERLATWPIDFAVDPQSWKDWLMVVLRFIPASIGLSLFILAPAAAPLHYQGRYAPLPYKFHGYAKVARNALEAPRSRGQQFSNSQVEHIEKRLLNPRYLCYLENPSDSKLSGAVPRRVDPQNKAVKYLFVAYSAEQFNHASTDDMEALHKLAERATRDVRLPAYWIACSCMPDANELEQDVYRISDVMRGAQSMIIIVGQPSNNPTINTLDLQLKQWGARMWTFPEVLLSPNKAIKVYVRGEKMIEPEIVPKNQFAARVWTDALVARQLIDHYLGNLGLSTLELTAIGLECLTSRETKQYLEGDHSYALMGLMRLRPKIDRTDSAFQAFARLSLLNDSNQLLERLICLLPPPNTPWHSPHDAYGCSLWDVYPTCQVAGIGGDTLNSPNTHEDTVIIDGAYGSSIRWKAFHSIAFAQQFSWRRWLAHKWLQSSFHGIYLGFVFLLFGHFNAYYYFLGFLFLLMGLSGWLASPGLLKKMFGGKYWGTQAAFFGIEGYVNLATIERAIFGGDFGRLSWAPFSSPWSRHVRNRYGECVGVDPMEDGVVREMIQEGKRAGHGQMRVFMLIDTYAMQVTLFQAVRPPIGLIICGSEGGMQRAIGVSYDWSTQTLYRETVLRLPTETLDRMSRVPKLKFGLKRPDVPARERGPNDNIFSAK